MDRQLTFEILLYLNMFFTGFYACIEAFFLLMKYLYVPDFDALTLLNEMFLLLALCGFEAARLLLGQEDNLHKKITQVDTIMGMILLIVQFIQMCCAAISCLPNRHRICFNPFETDWEKIE